jgi:putative CRISPR-associated protein (TIGR02619 family)
MDTRRKLECWLSDRKSLLSSIGALDELQKLSAELNSLIRYYQGHLQGNRDQHFLVCTDTWLGREAAEILRQCLTRYFQRVEVYAATDLQTGKLDGFCLAMSELIKWSDETLPGYREQGYRVVFNLTGGFKSIQGFMQTLGMFYADKYLYLRVRQ